MSEDTVMQKIALNLINTTLLVVRYGLVAWAISYGAGAGCKSWPLVKKKQEAIPAFVAGK